jgi:uncharacterized protein YjbJ (UPF0337 family)
MNEEQLRGRWNELKGKVKERWGRLTDDELAQINGRKEQLLGKIQVKYGIAKERAEKELKRFLDSVNFSSTPSNPSDSQNSSSGSSRKEEQKAGRR